MTIRAGLLSWESGSILSPAGLTCLPTDWCLSFFQPKLSHRNSWAAQKKYMLAQNFAQAYIFSVQAYIFFLLLSGEKLLSYAPVCLASSASTPSILEGELQAVLHYESREPSCFSPYTYYVPNDMQTPPLSGGPSGEDRKGVPRGARGCSEGAGGVLC